jgi:hypothetical protein
VRERRLLGKLQPPDLPQPEHLDRHARQSGGGGVRRLQHRPQRHHRHRVLAVDPQRADLRRGVLPAGQDAHGGEVAAAAAEPQPGHLRDHLQARTLPHGPLPERQRDRRRGAGHVRDDPGGERAARSEQAAPLPPEHANVQHAEGAAPQSQRHDAELHDSPQERIDARAELQPWMHDAPQKCHPDEQHGVRHSGDAAAGVGAAPERQRHDADERAAAAAAPQDQESPREPALVVDAPQQQPQQGEHASPSSGHERDASVIISSERGEHCCRAYFLASFLMNCKYIIRNLLWMFMCISVHYYFSNCFQSLLRWGK